LIVVIWEAGLGFELLETPSLTPAPIDIRTALEVDRSIYEGARQLAETGAAIARQAGMDATGLAVADDVTVAETLVRLTKEHHARAVVVGTHGRRRLLHQTIGSTTRAVVEQATCPAVVIRHSEADS
jgi:nucleotide-binding universal stress UspA family protein